MLSITEAVYFGVPVIGIPGFGDQISNVQNAALNGYAIRLDLASLDEETFYNAIQEMLSNPKLVYTPLILIIVKLLFDSFLSDIVKTLNYHRLCSEIKL